MLLFSVRVCDSVDQDPHIPFPVIPSSKVPPRPCVQNSQAPAGQTGQFSDTAFNRLPNIY